MNWLLTTTIQILSSRGPRRKKIRKKGKIEIRQSPFFPSRVRKRFEIFLKEKLVKERGSEKRERKKEKREGGMISDGLKIDQKMVKNKDDRIKRKDRGYWTEKRKTKTVS